MEEVVVSSVELVVMLLVSFATVRETLAVEVAPVVSVTSAVMAWTPSGTLAVFHSYEYSGLFVQRPRPRSLPSAC